MKLLPNTFSAILALVLLIGIPASESSAIAQLDLPAGASEPEVVDPEPVIDATATQPRDDEIKDRLTGIFSQVPALEPIEIEVAAGVVTLSGTVGSNDDVVRAEEIAARVSGVVTVENQVERSLDVGDNLNPISDRLERSVDTFVSSLPLMLIALVILVGFWLIGGLLSRMQSIWRWIAPNIFLAELIATSVRIMFIAIGLILALDLLQATALIGAIIGSAGLIGLAIGFAVRDAVNNYVSSIMLSIRQPFRAKDHVVIGEHEGHVIRLTSRATILMTLDGNHLRIPNSTVFQAEILNYTTNPERRLRFDLGIDAEDDPAAAIATGLEEMRALSFVLADPQPAAYIKQVGDSNIVIEYSFWIDQTATAFYKARSNGIRAVKNILEAQGFGLPEPIYRLRFDSGTPLEIARSATQKTPAPKMQPAKPQREREEPAEQDVSRDDSISRKVEGERRAGAEEDILDSGRPLE